MTNYVRNKEGRVISQERPVDSKKQVLAEKKDFLAQNEACVSKQSGKGASG